MNPPTVGGRFAAKDVGGGVPDAPGGVKTPPYDAKDKGDTMARLRAGYARPLRGGGWLAGAGREVRAAYMLPPKGRRIVISVFRTNIIIYPKRCS